MSKKIILTVSDDQFRAIERHTEKLTEERINELRRSGWESQADKIGSFDAPTPAQLALHLLDREVGLTEEPNDEDDDWGLTNWGDR